MANNFNSGNDSGRPNSSKLGKVAAGVGIATAAAVGAAWANARSRQYQRTGGVPTLIDWDKVRGMAYRMNPESSVSAEWQQHWDEYYSKMVSKAVPIIEDYAHTSFPRELNTVRAASRNEWIDANIASFQQLFEPFERLNREAAQKSSAFTQVVMGSVNQNVISAEVGLLLGYLARRVLGQYDLSLLGKEPVAAGKVYFVEPNINGTVQSLNLNGDDFRLWIALHETTHAFEFESHPWVRQHFNSILEKYFNYISEDLGKMRQNGGLGGFLQRVRSNTAPADGWIERIMTPEQRALFQELQAIMSIVEGYSNHMMNAIGATLLPNYEQIKERIESRQKNRSIIDRLFFRLTGMNLKMEQYRLGEIFVDTVVAAKGIDFANLMWAEAKYLPTLEEVKEPQRWISRVEQMQAA
ncbi:MAG TPA: zinc-dependent metalloprotease [Chloroflexia bacterium]|nr:zinc-dependent metalloprotease [Chloroflexia bacterium]